MQRGLRRRRTESRRFWSCSETLLETLLSRCVEISEFSVVVSKVSAGQRGTNRKMRRKYVDNDPRKACLRLSRFPAPLVTPAFGFSCSYGIYYMKGRHRRARFVRIEHDTQLRNFTDANCTQNIHTNTRIFRRQSGPEVLKARPSVRGGGGHVRAPSTVVHGAARSQTCAGADGDVSV